MSQVRKANASDVVGIKQVLDSTELFPSEYAEGMMTSYLEDPKCGEVWLVAVDDSNQCVGFSYCVPEKLTEGTYNLLAIAVLKELQGKGTGHKLVERLEEELKEAGARILIVETSGDEQYAATRQFYLKQGYRQEAVIREFWKTGEDKVIFWKKLIL